MKYWAIVGRNVANLRKPSTDRQLGVTRIQRRVWWKACACASGRKLADTLSQIVKRWSAAGVAHDVVMASGKMVRTFVVYVIIDIWAMPLMAKLRSIPR